MTMFYMLIRLSGSEDSAVRKIGLNRPTLQAAQRRAKEIAIAYSLRGLVAQVLTVAREEIA